MTSLSILLAFACSAIIGIAFPKAQKCIYCISAALFAAGAILLGFNVDKFVNFYGGIAYILFFAVFLAFAAGLFLFTMFVAKKFR